MLHVKAHVHREGRFFVINIRDYGVTQAESAGEVVLMATDYVASLAEVEPGQVVVHLVGGGAS